MPVSAGEADSSSASIEDRVKRLGEELERLKDELDPPDGEGSTARRRSEDTRSRRRWVESVLKALRDRPGRIRFNGNATSIVQIQEDGTDLFGTATGSFDLFVHTPLGEQVLFFVDLEAVGGNGPGGTLPSITALNGDAGSTQGAGGFDRTHVLEAWVEISFSDEHVRLTAGKIDVTNYFDGNRIANDETAQFITGGFINSTALPAPDGGPGVRLKLDVGERGALQFAAASSDVSGDRIFEELFLIGSVSLTAGDEDHTTNLRVFGYPHGEVDRASGYGLSVDHSLGSGFSLFGRWGQNTGKLAAWSGVKWAWSGGAQFEWANRLGDAVIAAAVGATRPEPSALNEERIAEIYFRQQLNRWTSVSPHLQVIDQASGSSDRHVIGGIRTQFDF